MCGKKDNWDLGSLWGFHFSVWKLRPTSQRMQGPRVGPVPGCAQAPRGSPLPFRGVVRLGIRTEIPCCQQSLLKREQNPQSWVLG